MGQRCGRVEGGSWQPESDGGRIVARPTEKSSLKVGRQLSVSILGSSQISVPGTTSLMNEAMRTKSAGRVTRTRSSL